MYILICLLLMYYTVCKIKDNNQCIYSNIIAIGDRELLISQIPKSFSQICYDYSYVYTL